MKLLALSLCLLFSACLVDSALGDSGLEAVAERVRSFRLDNGLKVLHYKRGVAPVFTGQLWVKVGGVDEVPGKTGVSHMLEHMAFKGTKEIGTKDYDKEKPLLEKLDALYETGASQEEKDEVLAKLADIWEDNEFSAVYENRGAVGLNAGTGKDYTFYTVSLPTSEFELWAHVETERLLNPVFRQFYKERDVVLEERRMRVESNPEGLLYERLIAESFLNHPNRLPTIGWPSDVSKLERSDLKELFDNYYKPHNMVLVVSGDLEFERVKSVVEKEFGRLKRDDSPVPVVRTEELGVMGPKEVKVVYDASDRVMLSFSKPGFPSVEDAQFSLLHILLADGRSSVLYKELVQERGLAREVYSFEAPGERFPPVFIIGAAPQIGVSNDQLVEEIQKVLDRLKSQSFDEAQVRYAKRKVRVSLLGSLISNYGIGRLIGKNELLWGDWKKIIEVYEQISNTTSEDIKSLFEKYTNKDNRVVVKLSSKL